MSNDPNLNFKNTNQFEDSTEIQGDLNMGERIHKDTFHGPTHTGDGNIIVKISSWATQLVKSLQKIIQTRTTHKAQSVVVEEQSKVGHIQQHHKRGGNQDVRVSSSEAQDIIQKQ